LKVLYIIGILITVLCSNSYAVKIKPTSIKSIVLDYAYVAKTGGELIEDDSRIGGVVLKDYEIKVIKEKVWIIPNKLGTGFYIDVGFGYIPASVKHFDLHIKYPEIVLPSGERLSSINRRIDIRGHDGTFIWSFDYFFDMAFEAIPGVWDIKVFSQGNLIHSSEFTVIDSNDQL
jgi:hypothetical protein